MRSEEPASSQGKIVSGRFREKLLQRLIFSAVRAAVSLRPQELRLKKGLVFEFFQAFLGRNQISRHNYRYLPWKRKEAVGAPESWCCTN